MSELIKTELTQYRRLKAVCHKRLQSELEFTAAIAEIRERKLYRAEYGTFEAFCQGEFERTARHIHRRLAQNKLYTQIKNVAPGIHFSMPGVLRPLLGLKPEQQLEAVEKAVDKSDSGKVTRMEIAAEAKELKRNGTYRERSAVMNSDARREELKVIGDGYKTFRDRLKQGTDLLVEAVNEAMKVGLHLRTVRGHEKMDKTFWRTHCQKSLPFDLEAAKQCISVNERLPEGAKSLAEAMVCLQPVLQAEKLIPRAQRAEAQTPSGITPAQSFYLKLSLLRPLYNKMIAAMPMELWGREELNEFLEETRFIAEERERANTQAK
jgi:hypothetical protein